MLFPGIAAFLSKMLNLSFIPKESEIFYKEMFGKLIKERRENLHGHVSFIFTVNPIVQKNNYGSIIENSNFSSIKRKLILLSSLYYVPQSHTSGNTTFL